MPAVRVRSGLPRAGCPGRRLRPGRGAAGSPSTASVARRATWPAKVHDDHGFGRLRVLGRQSTGVTPRSSSWRPAAGHSGPGGDHGHAGRRRLPGRQSGSTCAERRVCMRAPGRRARRFAEHPVGHVPGLGHGGEAGHRRRQHVDAARARRPPVARLRQREVALLGQRAR